MGKGLVKDRERRNSTGKIKFEKNTSKNNKEKR